MTSVSAGQIILTPTQPVGSGGPERESKSRPPDQKSRALPTELPPPPPPPFLDLTVSTNLLLSLTPSLTVFYRTMYRSIYPSYPLQKPIILFWIFEIQIMKTAITNSENHVHCLLIVVAQQHRERKKIIIIHCYWNCSQPMCFRRRSLFD